MFEFKDKYFTILLTKKYETKIMILIIVQCCHTEKINGAL